MVRDYDKDINNIQYGKSFAKDPKFSEILSDTSIDSKVTMTNVHKNINSLAGQLEKSQLDFHKQIKGISGSISSTVKQQEKLVKQIQMRELASTRDVKVVEKSIQQIMGKLGYTIDILGKSSKKILVDTARTTKETLKQYGQALSADFNINKSNFLAMSLAKASPIFGYFVGKFMETGIFKHFSELIKAKLGMAVDFVGNKIRDLWGRGTTKVKTWYNQRKESKQKQKELPKLQTGGYVTKAGAAKLHAAEVVAPVEKLRDMFTEALQPVTDTVKKIYSFMKWSAAFKMAKNVYRFFRRGKYSSYLSKTKDAQVKLVEDFGTFFNQSMLRYDEMIATLKGGKGKEKDTGFQFGTLGDFDSNVGKSKTDRVKIFAKSFTEEFGKAFKAELKKPESMFKSVKEKISGKEKDTGLQFGTLGDFDINVKKEKNLKDKISTAIKHEKETKELRNNLKEKGKDLKDKISTAITKEKETGEIRKDIKNIYKDTKVLAKDKYKTGKKDIKNIYKDTKVLAKDKYKTGKKDIKNIYKDTKKLYKTGKKEVKKGYKAFLKTTPVKETKKLIHNKITGVSGKGLTDAFSFVLKPITGTIKAIPGALKGIAMSFVHVGQGFVKIGKEVAMSFVHVGQGLIKGIKNLGKNLVSALQGVVMSFVHVGRSLVKGITDGVKFLTRGFAKIATSFLSVAGGIVGGIGIAKRTISNVISNIKKDGIFETAKGLISTSKKAKKSKTKSKDIGASTIAKIHKKEKIKKGPEGQMQLIRQSIEEFHGSVSKDWAEDKKKAKKEKLTMKQSWKSMIDQFTESKNTVKKQFGLFKKSFDLSKTNSKETKKIRKATEGTENKLGLGHFALKKAFSSIGTFAMIAFGMIKGFVGKIASGIWRVTKLISKIPFKAIGFIAKGLGTIVRFAIKRFPLIAGALSAFSMGKDAMTGLENAKDWHGVKEGKDASTSQKVTAAIGGALGGTESGVKGAKSGALKGAGMGMMIGSMIAPGIGTAIGGALGAIAGGVLGFVGGKNIAVALQSTWDSVKNVISAVTDMIMFPFKLMGKLVDKFMDWFKDPEKSALDKVKDVGAMILNVISWPNRMIFKGAASVLQYVSDHIPDFLKSALPSSVMSGLTETITLLNSMSEGLNTDHKSIPKSAESGANKAEQPKTAGVTRSYASGGIVPKPSKPLDGQGGQLALVHEGEKILPKSVVESAKLSGKPPEESRMGSSKPSMVDSIISGLEEMISSSASGMVGKLKVGYQKVKESLGPSSGFGWLSRMFESAGAGPAAIGWDRTGGYSYGYYQLAEKSGTPQRFLKQFPKIAQQFTGMQVGSDQFNERWKQLASTDPSFGQAQHEFIKQQYLNPYLAKIQKDTGFNLSARSPILQEVATSISVQHGPGSSVVSNALKGLPQNVTDEEMVKKIYEYKYANVGSHFKSSTSQVQNSVANRIQREASIALGSMGSGKGANPDSLPKASKGGVITKTGPIYAHEGEIIGPIKDVKESLLNAMLTKKDVARMQADKDTSLANLFNESTKGIQNSLQDSMNHSGKQTAVIVNSMTNSISSSMNSLAKSVSGGGGGGSNQGNDEISAILSGRMQ